MTVNGYTEVAIKRAEPETPDGRAESPERKKTMTKKEKEIAAAILSGCLDDMRKADMIGDAEAKAKATAAWKNYNRRIRDMFSMKFEILCTDYQTVVEKPIREILDLTMKFYSDRVNGTFEFTA